MKQVAIPVLCALVAVLARVPLLWDDPFAPGYDGWYYVLQVRSLMVDAPLFADRSLVFVVLRAMSWLVGDVVIANKVAACLFAAVGTAGAAVAATRWTDSRSAGVAAGVWWAVAPGHLIVSMEFLKNEAGLAVLGLLSAALAGLVGAERPVSRRWLVPVLVLVLTGPLVHKLTGVMGVLLAVGVGAGWAQSQVAWTRRGWVIGALVFAVVCAVLGVGVLRGVDLERFIAPQAGEGPRFDVLWASHRIHSVHRMGLLGAHVLPLVLVAGVWRSRYQALGLPLAGLACITAAPLLPFGFDLTAWRLLLLAFVPTAFGWALLVARTHWGVGPLVALVALTALPSTVDHTARGEPDYASWAEVVPTLQAHVPSDARVVAHRGLCGFVWAVADRICENFDPQGPPDDWWRIVYGMGEARLAPYSAVPPIPLRLGYTLVPEVAWRAFRADHGDTLPLVRHPRNPYRPRPGFVYGPGGGTPEAGSTDD